MIILEGLFIALVLFIRFSFKFFSIVADLATVMYMVCWPIITTMLAIELSIQNQLLDPLGSTVNILAALAFCIQILWWFVLPSRIGP